MKVNEKCFVEPMARILTDRWFFFLGFCRGWALLCGAFLCCLAGQAGRAQSPDAFAGTKNAPCERGLASLPAENGQFWMTYDISSYTSQFPNLVKPQQSIVQWILYDTPDDFWQREPFGVFSASKTHLYVYHNEQVQKYMTNVIDRFLDPEKRSKSFQIRILVLQAPDWRTQAMPYLHPFSMDSPDYQGWTLEPDGYRTVVADLAKRSDFVELNAAQNEIPNGQTFGWVLSNKSKDYVRDIQISSETATGYVLENNVVEEGYRIEVTPLLSTDNQRLEILFRCQSNAVEKMLSFNLKAPSATAPRQQLTAELPQIARANLSGKFSFAKNQVFLLDLGMIPMKLSAASETQGFLNSLGNIIVPKTAYYNVLIFALEKTAS